MLTIQDVNVMVFSFSCSCPEPDMMNPLSYFAVTLLTKFIRVYNFSIIFTHSKVKTLSFNLLFAAELVISPPWQSRLERKGKNGILVWLSHVMSPFNPGAVGLEKMEKKQNNLLTRPG